MSDHTVRVCFVCLGNICRSPTAEAVMRKLVAEAGVEAHVEIDSAGTGAYHVGEPADARSRVEAARRGIELDGIARQFEADDFARFDYVVAMDASNLRDLRELAVSAADRAKLHLLRSFETGGGVAGGGDVPDPYHGGTRGFADVYDICEAACRGLLAHVIEVHRLT
jgi:protein-tyrosine phosphatase